MKIDGEDLDNLLTSYKEFIFFDTQRTGWYKNGDIYYFYDNKYKYIIDIYTSNITDRQFTDANDWFIQKFDYTNIVLEDTIIEYYKKPKKKSKKDCKQQILDSLREPVVITEKNTNSYGQLRESIEYFLYNDCIVYRYYDYHRHNLWTITDIENFNFSTGYVKRETNSIEHVKTVIDWLNKYYDKSIKIIPKDCLIYDISIKEYNERIGCFVYSIDDYTIYSFNDIPIQSTKYLVKDGSTETVINNVKRITKQKYPIKKDIRLRQESVKELYELY